MKGIENLITAWSIARPAGWKVLVCGPGEKGYIDRLEKSVLDAGLRHVFEFRPPIYDEGKALLLQESDLFLSPSLTENFGVAIAEALAAGLPVVTTKGAPWAELLTERCGWWVDVGPWPLADALRESTSLTDEELREMGARGRRLVEQKYTWESVGRKMVEVYKWAAGLGPRPEFVRTSSKL